MTERVIGPTGSPRRRWTLLLPLVAVFALGLLYIAGAQATHETGLFELDRNAVSSAAAGEDWDVVCPASITGCTGGTTADASSFVQDGIGPTIFTGGGSKDDLNTTGWKHKSGQTPDKDELLDGYAARYGDVVYFGADRYSGSGDAQMGVWFFQQEVEAQSGGTFGPGQHQNGDVLVLSNFSGGGGTVNIRVFEWHSPGGAINGTLDLIGGAEGSTADCVGPPVHDPTVNPFCATVNALSTDSPWPYTPKAGPAGDFPPGHFYEGGIDLAALGLADECFSSFLIETRSSTSVDAVLKDFVGGTFEVCEPDLTTQASTAGPVTPGTAVHDTATITVTGAASPDDATGTVTFYLCGPHTSATACVSSDSTRVQVGSAVALSDTSSPANANDGISGASSANVNTSGSPLQAGFYCFAAAADLTNYADPVEFSNNTTECFRVADTSSMTTAQNWLPNDSATVSSGGGSNLSGSVVFTLYDGAINCANPGSATVLYGPETKTLTNAASPATVSTSNSATTITVASNKTVTWRVVFTSSDSNVGSPSAPTCETSLLTITN